MEDLDIESVCDRIVDELKELLASLATTRDPVECVAQGKIEVAVQAIEAARDLLT